MENIYVKRSLFTMLMGLSFLFGIVLFLTNHFDFCIKAVDTGHLNTSNLAYILIHFIDVLLLPIIFIAHARSEFGRIKTAKALFIVLGLLHIATLSWAVYFLGSNPSFDIISNAKITEFQANTDNALVYNYVTWDTYNWAGSIFAMLYGIMCIYTGINFDDNRVKVRRCVIALAASRLILPLIHNILFQQRLYSMFWITNNYSAILSYAFFTAAVVVVSFHDDTWVECIWDTPPIDPENDDELI